MQVKTFYFNPFRECTYLLQFKNGQTFVIDCGCYTLQEQQRLEEYIKHNHLNITRHLLTHAHLDHTLGARFIYENYGVLPTLAEKDSLLLLHTAEQAQMFGLPLMEEPLTEFLPLENDKHFSSCPTPPVDLWSAFPTPGHTQGSVCYWFQDAENTILFTGDTLFASGIGRTDLPGGDYSALTASLRLLMTLSDNTQVFPGHGYPTTIAQEKQHNPYL